MAARQFGNTKPRDFGLTVRTLLSYMGRHKFLLLAVAVLVTISALANLIGTYMIRPVVNDVAAGDAQSLLSGVITTAVIYAVGALAALGYTQIMVKAAQRCSMTSGAISLPTCRSCRCAFSTRTATAM